MSVPDTPDPERLGPFRAVLGPMIQSHDDLLAATSALAEKSGGLAPLGHVVNGLIEARAQDECEHLLLSPREFAEMSGPPPTWLVDGLIPRGAMVMALGIPKAGKSTLVRDLIRCVATGTPFLGRDTEQGRVFYSPYEENAGDVNRSLERLGVPEGAVTVPATRKTRVDVDPETGAAVTTSEIEHEHDLTIIERYIRRLKPVLFVLDPLALAIPMEDENRYAEGYRMLEPFRRIATLYNVSVLLAHHEGKSRIEAITQRGLGTTAFGGAPWGTLSLRVDGDGVRTLDSTGRAGNHFSRAIVELDPETLRLRLAGTVADRHRTRLLDEILESAREMSDPFTRDDVLRPIEGRTSEKHQAFRDALTRGELVKFDGTGKRGSPFRYVLRSALPEVPHVPGIPERATPTDADRPRTHSKSFPIPIGSGTGNDNWLDPFAEEVAA